MLKINDSGVPVAQTTTKEQIRIRRINLTVLILIIALSIAAAVFFFFFDRKIFLSIHNSTTDWQANYWLNSFKQLGKAWVPVWLLLLWAWLTNKLRPPTIALLAMLIVVPLVVPLKVTVRRQRPKNSLLAQNHPDKHDINRNCSFPSGDTATVFAAATATAFFVSWHWLPALAAASVIIAFLRVLFMAHYPADVCAGAALGILAGWLAFQISRRWHSLDSEKFDVPWRIGVAIVLVISVPLIGLSEKVNPLWLFIKAYWPLILAICIIANAKNFKTYLKANTPHAAKESQKNNQ